MRKRKSRRTYGSGSIVANKKLKRYTVRWYDDSGKMHSCSRFALTDDGKNAAIAYLDQRNQDARQAQSRDRMLSYWLLAYVQQNLPSWRVATRAAYKRAITLLQKEATLLCTEIDLISAADITAYYSRLESSGRGITTIRNIHTLVRGSIIMAIQAQAAQKNVLGGVKVPRLSNKNKKIKIFTGRDIGAMLLFIRRMKKPPVKDKALIDLHLFFRVLVQTGCRVGEAIALRWSDIDIAAREIHIQRTCTGTTGVIEETPKTSAGDRYIPILSDRLLSILEARYQHTDGYVFQQQNGKPVTYKAVYVAYTRAAAACKVEGRNIHCFRHSFATNLIAKGIPIPEVSRIIGHRDSAITLSIYAHAIPRSNSNIIKMYKKNAFG